MYVKISYQRVIYHLSSFTSWLLKWNCVTLVKLKLLNAYKNSFFSFFFIQVSLSTVKFYFRKLTIFWEVWNFFYAADVNKDSFSNFLLMCKFWIHKIIFYLLKLIYIKIRVIFSFKSKMLSSFILTGANSIIIPFMVSCELTKLSGIISFNDSFRYKSRQIDSFL